MIILRYYLVKLFFLLPTHTQTYWCHLTIVGKMGTLTNVLPHRNAIPQTQDMIRHSVTVYRHGVDLSLCYPLMWNVTLEYTATHFNVLGETRTGNPSPTFHTHQRTLNLMLLWWLTVGSSVESTVPTGSWTRDLWCANPLRYPLAHSDFLKNILKQKCLELWKYNDLLYKMTYYIHISFRKYSSSDKYRLRYIYIKTITTILTTTVT